MHSSFLSIERSCKAAAPWIKKCLVGGGLRVLQTFDLQSARLGLKECPCPHHGTDQCGCEMIVMLIYGWGGTPATLILHGNETWTWISLVDNPAQPAGAFVRASIERALQIGPPREGL